MTVVWHRTWPTKPGRYWFYGKLSSALKQEISFVDVFLDATKQPTYVCGNRFVYKDDGAEGVWAFAGVPEVPTEADIVD